ncbi:biotin-dependent carboxyltransferase family protein [Neobacillus mesonae]|uniref:5-oxoprolinase subunit C family protein n=1 Tax=Neobacillus mesonae TaxID=1193713 RepID=UPI002E1EF240|nr:biotin-dependent carboxyltransferase family protein [Neobacillus mesonae]
MKPGLLTTIQDLGRHGYQKYGLAVSGSADPYAHRMANILVGNAKEAALLEVTLMGLKLLVKEPAVIAITGGDLNPLINGKETPMWTSVHVKEGDVIQFKGPRTGCRSYLAVTGGIDVPKVLGSRATDLVGQIGGLNGRMLKKGDIIHVFPKSLDGRRGRKLSKDLIPQYENNINIRVILGPQDEAFTEEGIKTFLSSTYTVTKDVDRMGCRLEGAIIEHKDTADIISEGIFYGAIQVPKNGQPIIFLVGRQSVGGYTKIGGVITVDLPKIGQVKPGDSITFTEVTIDKAQEELKQQNQIFKILSATC